MGKGKGKKQSAHRDRGGSGVKSAKRQAASQIRNRPPWISCGGYRLNKKTPASVFFRRQKNCCLAQAALKEAKNRFTWKAEVASLQTRLREASEDIVREKRVRRAAESGLRDDVKEFTKQRNKIKAEIVQLQKVQKELETARKNQWQS